VALDELRDGFAALPADSTRHVGVSRNHAAGGLANCARG
jgi:hypothetical protein